MGYEDRESWSLREVTILTSWISKLGLLSLGDSYEMFNAIDRYSNMKGPNLKGVRLTFGLDYGTRLTIPIILFRVLIGELYLLDAEDRDSLSQSIGWYYSRKIDGSKRS